MEKINIEDEISFKNSKSYKIKDISIKDFNNVIWRSGFVYGMMTGGALVILIITAIIFPFS